MAHSPPTGALLVSVQRDTVISTSFSAASRQVVEDVRGCRRGVMTRPMTSLLGRVWQAPTKQRGLAYHTCQTSCLLPPPSPPTVIIYFGYGAKNPPSAAVFLGSRSTHRRLLVKKGGPSASPLQIPLC